MTEKKSEVAASRAALHPKRVVSGLSGGGFSVEAPGRAALLAVPSGDGWRVGGPNDARGWRLFRSSEGGFVVEQGPEGRELARTMPLVGTGRAAGSKLLLLEDGRLFRIALTGARIPGFELTGWETRGAYLTARPSPGGWILEPQPSSCGWADLDLPSLLLAAEALDADRCLTGPEA